jgi:arylsulfatase A-like enzyme
MLGMFICPVRGRGLSIRIMRKTIPMILAVMAAFVLPTSGQAKPNVLFIAVDDLVTTLGCYGDRYAQTPQIDSLASQGMTFRSHHCQWAVCGPSRAALSTSLMPEETNVMGFKKIRDKNFLPNVTTLPQHFKNHGYETACTGKFHDPRTVGTPTAISGTYPDGVMDNGTSVDDPDSWSVPYLDAPSGFNTPTKVAVDATDQADSLYEDHKILTAGLTLIDDLVASGGSAPGNKPFFLAIGFKKPHLPFVVPKAYWDLYDRNAAPMAAFTGMPLNTTTYNSNTLLNNSEMLGGGDDTTNGYEPYRTDNALLQVADNQRELIHGYYACVSFIDKLVGDIRTKLAATDDPLQPGKKLSETTIVILWGDHGFHLGDHGRWAKHTAMDRGTASPFILFDPRSPRNASNNTTFSPVGTIDIYPTLCELAGLPIPEQPADTASTTGRPIRGRSLVPILQNPDASVHDGVVSQFNINGQYGYAYRTERFRYIEWVNATGNMNDGNPRRDLFDYQLDPLETRNLANDPAYAAIVYQLSRSLRAETTIRGTGRLNLAAPIATGGDAFLPFVRIDASGNDATLTWPGSGGVSYDIHASTTLASGSWGDDFTNLQGPAVTFPMVGERRFFRVGFGANTPPRFLSDPVTKPAAYSGTAYSNSLAANVSDPGDSLTFSKTAGPAWLTVAANGTLGGTPAPADQGANYFSVRVTDSSGCHADAALQISVFDPAANQAPAFAADPVVKAAAVENTPYSATLAGDASDPDAGQTLAFSLISGPPWLAVAADGTLSGTPSSADLGANVFTIRVTDPLGAYDEAQLSLTVNPAPSGTIEVVSKQNAATSAINYGTTYFSGVTVQAGDLVVVSHANNKNTSANTITLSGLGGNTIQSVNSGSSGTTSSAWVFHSLITQAGTFDFTLDTSNTTTKTVSQATTLFVLRPSTGAVLEVVSTDGSVVASGATELALDFAMSPAVSNAYGIAAAAVNTSTLASNPAGWTQEVDGNLKRRTLSNADIDGSSHTATFSTAAASDIALAGIVVKVAAAP